MDERKTGKGIDMKKDSPCIAFLRLAWSNASKGVPFSWERLNHTMGKAMYVAIGAFKFELGDFEQAQGEFDGGRWCHIEQCYAVAIANGNTSACLSIEKYLGREPIIADLVRVPSPGGDCNVHMTGDRQRERLFVGAQTKWKGETVTVTSFGKDGAVACSYKPRETGVTDKQFSDWLDRLCLKTTKLPKEATEKLRRLCERDYADYSRKILRRYTITREAVIAERAEMKRRSDIETKFVDLCGNDKEAVLAQLAKIGVSKSADFFTVPLKKLETLLAKLERETQ
jgi:hypothetical protein